MVVEITAAQYLQLWRNMITNPYAAMRYTPKPYDGKLTLFRGNSTGRENDYGWSRFALGGVDVYHFDSDHEHFVAEANAPAVAAQLSICIGIANGDVPFQSGEPGIGERWDDDSVLAVN